MMVELYSQRKDRVRLGEAFRRQHKFSRLWDETQRQMYRYSVELMLQISELREEQEQHRRENELLKRRAETDPLTKLPNRHALNHILTQSLERAQLARRSFGIGMIDIDAFKQYNDRYGHAQGDRCLCLVAEALQSIAAKHGLFTARYGGDEFVVIYEGRTDRQIEAIEAEIHQLMQVSVSHGYCNELPDDDSRPFTLLAKADAAMYRNKRGTH